MKLASILGAFVCYVIGTPTLYFFVCDMKVNFFHQFRGFTCLQLQNRNFLNYCKSRKPNHDLPRNR